MTAAERREEYLHTLAELKHARDSLHEESVPGCSHCGGELPARAVRFCSDVCRKRAWRRRRRGVAEDILQTGARRGRVRLEEKTRADVIEERRAELLRQLEALRDLTARREAIDRAARS